jgi:phytoene/squalene synthetase
LILYVCGYNEQRLHDLSDLTCTALQLANFWQDVARDYEIGRIYMPLDAMARHQYSEADLAALRYNENFAGLMRELVDRTWDLFNQGLPLARLVERKLAVDIELFSRGGMEILRLIERQNFNVLAHRPELSSTNGALLFGSVLARHIFHSRRREPQPA